VGGVIALPPMKKNSRFSSAGTIVGAAMAILAMAPGGARAAAQDAEIPGGTPPPVEPVRLVYPYEQALAGVQGDAVVQFNIDADGFAREVSVVNASQPAFGLAAKSMIAALRFAPVVQGGKAVPRMGLKQEDRFNRDSLDAGARAMIDELKKAQPAIAKARELDQVPPKLAKYVNPVFPQAMLDTGGTGGEAVIECIIDATGHVQLPRIISATTDDCGWAAATAVLRWEFAPPTRGGKPVATRMRIPLEFVRPKAGPATPAASGT
jgi:TonB family protein